MQSGLLLQSSRSRRRLQTGLRLYQIQLRRDFKKTKFLTSSSSESTFFRAGRSTSFVPLFSAFAKYAFHKYSPQLRVRSQRLQIHRPSQDSQPPRLLVVLLPQILLPLEVEQVHHLHQTENFHIRPRTSHTVCAHLGLDSMSAIDRETMVTVTSNSDVF